MKIRHWIFRALLAACVLSILLLQIVLSILLLQITTSTQLHREDTSNSMESIIASLPLSINASHTDSSIVAVSIVKNVATTGTKFTVKKNDFEMPHRVKPSMATRGDAKASPTSNASNSPSFNHSQSIVLKLLPPDYQARVESSVLQAIQPIWSCKTKNPSLKNTKLAFVHVFKTAGSTIRQFFLDYAGKCVGHSYATLTKCTNVDVRKLVDSASSSWHPCQLENHRDRQGKYQSFHHRSVQASKLNQNYDILGGHFRLGLLDHLQPNNKGSMHKKNGTAAAILPSTNVRNVIFFRNAAAKYVSGKLYVKTVEHKHWNVTLQAVLKDITNEVKYSSRVGRYHSKYATYLLTPTQQNQASLEQWSRQYQVQVMARNLIDNNVTIGIVENMTQSMQLLQHLLDAQGQATSLFQAYSTTTTSESSKRRNVSPISTGAILNHLQQEQPESYQKLLKFVSYEQQVTDFAVALHELQYQALVKNNPTS